MAKDTEHFKVSEFTCKCGCGKNNIDQRVLDMAETIRQALGVPVRVNSGCRCEEWNRIQKGVSNSRHISGKAADLSCGLGSAKMFETVKKLHAEGKLPALDYCIKYRTFIHIDCGGKRKTLWEVRG